MTKTTKAKKADDKRSILINFVLDKSGSMDCIRDATISGFNEFKNDQAKEEGDAFFTLTLFDTSFWTPLQTLPIADVRDLDHAHYQPSGMTALYDAIGYTMRITDEFVAAHKPDQVLFVIMTDGAENSSREFTRDKIFAMIKDRQDKAKYEFIYLGANQDSYLAGREMGMRDGRMLDYAHSAAGSQEAFLRASHNVRAMRRHATAQREDFFSSELEALGKISSEEWQAMTPEERQKRLDEGRGKG